MPLEKSRWAGSSVHCSNAVISSSHIANQPTSGPTYADRGCGSGKTKSSLPLTARYEALCQRVRWRSDNLVRAYGLASAYGLTGPQQFCMDIFEWYAVVEKAVALALQAFKIEVPRIDYVTSRCYESDVGAVPGVERKEEEEQNREPAIFQTGRSKQERLRIFGEARQQKSEVGPGLRSGELEGVEDRMRRGKHRYHANLLAVLANPTGPLYEFLGRGEAWNWLNRALGMRNGAKELVESGRVDDETRVMPLTKSEVESMVQSVVAGLDEASQRIRKQLGAQDGERMQGVVLEGLLGVDEEIEEDEEMGGL